MKTIRIEQGIPLLKKMVGREISIRDQPFYILNTISQVEFQDYHQEQ